MKYLLVEDEQGIANFVVQGLTELGYAIDHVVEGDIGYEYAASGAYDVIILDIMLPKMDGIQFLIKYRENGGKSPVILLTAKADVDDRVAGLDAGADDYLAKPFAFQELLARLHALQRRPPLENNPVLRHGDLAMDLPKRLVTMGEKPIELSVREFSLLEMFLRHPHQVLSRTQLAQMVWNFDFSSDTNVVDVYVGYLRKKLGKHSNNPYIHTVHGIGYKLNYEAS